MALSPMLDDWLCPRQPLGALPPDRPHRLLGGRTDRRANAVGRVLLIESAEPRPRYTPVCCHSRASYRREARWGAGPPAG